MNHAWPLRLAVEADVPELEALIERSVWELHAPYYSEAQRRAAMGPVFGVDRALIRDGTYYVAEWDGQIAGCGGWSRRKAVFGGDRCRPGEDEYIDPKNEPARIRAFFVDPKWNRKGIGRALLFACEEAIRNAGFSKAVMVATLAGEPLYTTHGYAVDERYDIAIAGSDITLAAVRMSKTLTL